MSIAPDRLAVVAGADGKIGKAIALRSG